MAKILLVEDDRGFCTLVEDALALENHQVETAYDGRDALTMLEVYKYDLVVLDWHLPYKSGVDVCREFRARGGRTPILMLTARESPLEKEEGLDAGADDYLTKPFHVRELCARVRALLRRGGAAISGNILTCGNLSMDPSKHYAEVDGREITLSPKEFALLEFLLRNQNLVFNTESLLDRVWMSDSDSTPEAVRTCVRRLRKRLQDEACTCEVEAVYGVGYKLVLKAGSSDATVSGA